MTQSGELKLTTSLRLRRSAHFTCHYPPNGKFLLETIPLPVTIDWIPRRENLPKSLEWCTKKCKAVFHEYNAARDGEVISLKLTNILDPQLQYAVRICKVRPTGKIRQLSPVLVLDRYHLMTPPKPRIRTITSSSSTHWVVWSIQKPLMAPLPTSWEFQVGNSLDPNMKWFTVLELPELEPFRDSVVEANSHVAVKDKSQPPASRYQDLPILNWRVKQNFGLLLLSKTDIGESAILSGNLTVRVRGRNQHGTGPWSSADSNRAKAVTGRDMLLCTEKGQYSSLLEKEATGLTESLPPTNLTCSLNRPSCVVLNWSLPTTILLSEGVLEFECDISKDNAVWGRLGKVQTLVPFDCGVVGAPLLDTKSFSCVVRGLESLSRYYVRLRVKNAACGWGVYSESILVRTTCSSLPGAPRRVRTEARSVTEVEVSWKVPETECAGSPVTEYIVDFERSPYAKGSSELLPYSHYERIDRQTFKRLTVPGTFRRISLKNLPLNVVWSARVRARNISGVGSWGTNSDQHWPAVTGFEFGDEVVVRASPSGTSLPKWLWEGTVEEQLRSRSDPGTSRTFTVNLHALACLVHVSDADMFECDKELPEVGQVSKGFPKVIRTSSDFRTAVQLHFTKQMPRVQSVQEYPWFKQRDVDGLPSPPIPSIVENIIIGEQYKRWQPTATPEKRPIIDVQRTNQATWEWHQLDTNNLPVVSLFQLLESEEPLTKSMFNTEQMQELLQNNQQLNSMLSIRTVEDAFRISRTMHSLYSLQKSDTYYLSSQSIKQPNMRQVQLSVLFNSMMQFLNRDNEEGEDSKPLTLRRFRDLLAKRSYISTLLQKYALLKPVRRGTVLRWMQEELSRMCKQFSDDTELSETLFVESLKCALEMSHVYTTLDITHKLLYCNRQCSYLMAKLKDVSQLNSLKQSKVVWELADSALRMQVFRFISAAQTKLVTIDTLTSRENLFKSACIIAVQAVQMQRHFLSLIHDLFETAKGVTPPPPTKTLTKPRISDHSKPRTRPGAKREVLPDIQLESRISIDSSSGVDTSTKQRVNLKTVLEKVNGMKSEEMGNDSTSRQLRWAFLWLFQRAPDKRVLEARVGMLMHWNGHRRKEWRQVSRKQLKEMLSEGIYRCFTRESARLLFQALHKASGFHVRLALVKDTVLSKSVPQELVQEHLELLHFVHHDSTTEHLQKFAHELMRVDDSLKRNVARHGRSATDEVLRQLQPTFRETAVSERVFVTCVEHSWFHLRLFKGLTEVLVLLLDLIANSNIHKPRGGSGIEGVKLVREMRGEADPQLDASIQKGGVDDRQTGLTSTTLSFQEAGSMNAESSKNSSSSNVPEVGSGNPKLPSKRETVDLNETHSSTVGGSSGGKPMESDTEDPRSDDEGGNHGRNSDGSKDEGPSETPIGVVLPESEHHEKKSEESQDETNALNKKVNATKIVEDSEQDWQQNNVHGVDWSRMIALHPVECFFRVAAARVCSSGNYMVAPLVNSDASMKRILLDLYRINQRQVMSSNVQRPAQTTLGCLVQVSYLELVHEFIIAEFTFLFAALNSSFNIEKANKEDPSKRKIRTDQISWHKVLKNKAIVAFLQDQVYISLLLVENFHDSFYEELEAELDDENGKPKDITAEDAADCFSRIYVKLSDFTRSVTSMVLGSDEDMSPEVIESLRWLCR